MSWVARLFPPGEPKEAVGGENPVGISWLCLPGHASQHRSVAAMCTNMCLYILLQIATIAANGEVTEDRTGVSPVSHLSRLKSVVIHKRDGKTVACFTQPKEFVPFLSELRSIPDLKAVEFWRSTITDSEIAAIPVLSSVEHISIRDERSVTDESLRSLGFPISPRYSLNGQVFPESA